MSEEPKDERTPAAHRSFALTQWDRTGCLTLIAVIWLFFSWSFDYSMNHSISSSFSTIVRQLNELESRNPQNVNKQDRRQAQ